MPEAQKKQEAVSGLYSQDQLAAYLEYQRSGKATQARYFDQPVGETVFTDGDRILIREARKEHRKHYSDPKVKQQVIAELRKKQHVVTGHRINVLGNKRVVRLTDTSIELPKAKPTLKLVKTPKVKTAAPAPAAPTVLA